MGTSVLSPKTNNPIKIIVPYRRTINKLKPSQLKFFYENFVIRCENDESPLKYFNINSREVKIELIDVIPPKTMKKKDLEKLWVKGEKRPTARITMYAKISSFIRLKKILLGIINTQQ